ncbi:MAG: WD40/YVTN/BNR-like repeat-containing protein [Actinomycetota bacterium]
MPRVLVATSDGLRSFDHAGSPGPVDHPGRAVTALAADRDELWCVLDGSELWHAPDGDRWVHLARLGGHRITCVAVTDGVVVGSSEARLFRLGDEGLRPIEPFDRAEGRSGWYTPWGGPPDTRSISEWGRDVYVNVHVGGILRTDDGGQTWAPTIDVDADVHQVATAQGLVLAACAGGLAVSSDRGVGWTFRREGLEARYSRAVAVCGEAVLLSTSSGPRGGRAAVYRGDLAGGPLERCRGGLPGWFDDNIDTYRLDALPDGSFAAFGTSDGAVFVSEDAGTTWSDLVSGLPPIHRLLVLR